MRARVLSAMLCVLFALPGGAAAQGLDTTCQFSLTRLDATTTNVLAVYISWNVYDAAARPIDALSDVQLTPDPGSTNPFLPGASRPAASCRLRTHGR